MALNIGWIFHGSNNALHGKRFLNKIVQQENLEFYKIKSLQITIEFFYQKLKRFLVFYLAPIYFLNVLLFLAMSELNEIYREGVFFDYESD